MDRFLQDMTTTYWWLSVFVIGIAINLFAAYLKTPLDNFYSRVSLSKRLASEKRNAELENRAQAIATDTSLLIHTKIDILLHNIRATMSIAMFILTLVIIDSLPESIYILILRGLFGMFYFLMVAKYIRLHSQDAEILARAEIIIAAKKELT